MKTVRKNDKQPSANKEVKTVRGSGYTYTEKKERTDKSIPISQAHKEEIVPLPDLGQKNRP